MTTFAANLSMLFTEVPFLERFGRAARAGFRHVECQFPYEATPEAIKAELEAHGLSLILHNLPAGHWAAGERGIACHPDRTSEFEQGVAQAGRIGGSQPGERHQAPLRRGVEPFGDSRQLALDDGGEAGFDFGAQ